MVDSEKIDKVVQEDYMAGRGGDDSVPQHRANDSADSQMNRDRGVEEVVQSIGANGDDRKTQSAPDGLNRTASIGQLSSSPERPGRISLCSPRPPGLESQIHLSDEFDRRFDGPFGRPSITMTRRISIPTNLQEDGTLSSAAAPSDIVAATAPGGSLARPFEPEPPPLNYTLRTRKLSILIWWTVIVFDSVVMPIALYFGLWYGVGPGNPADERISANTVFSVVTAAIGGASILEYFIRLWRLWKKDSNCKVLNAKRWYLDFFHWNFTIAWLIVMVELIVGSVRHDPLIRLLATPLATMLLVFGTLLLTIDTARYFQVPAPVRISSMPRGTQLRPGIYSLIEDICAVDGSGGTEFRQALDRRYEASHVFRAMLRRLGIFWAVGAEACGVMTLALVLGLSNADIAYTIGWSVPFIWAGVWALINWWWVDIELKREKRLWLAEAEKARV